MSLVEANGSGITGKLYLKQSNISKDVTFEGQILNLPAGAHGFHVHTNGAIGNNCTDAGDHFNPTNVCKLANVVS